jgi:hypothetical protein
MSDKKTESGEFKSEMLLGLSVPALMVGLVMAILFTSIGKK